MRTLKAQFIFSHILPLLIVIPLVAAALIYLLEVEVLLNGLSEELTEQGLLLAASIDDRPELLRDVDEAQHFVTEISILVSSQVFLLDPNGELLASGEPPTADPPDTSIPLDTLRSGESIVVLNYGLTNQQAEVLVPVTNVDEQLIGVIALRDTLQGVTSGFSRLRQLVLLVLSAELILGAMIGLGLAVRLARPIEQATSAVVDAADGRRPEPLPVEGPQEIRQLSRSVNILSERLRLLEEARRHSLANLVHELGRPLGAIKSAVYVLRQEVGDDPAIRQELLEGIASHLDHMEPLLDDLTLLHSQVTGQRVLALQPIPLSHWLVATLLPWRAAALNKELRWEAIIPPNLPTLNIDPTRMAQVLGNLLNNAISYTPTGGRVQVTAATQENTSDGPRELVIQVSDTGPGIALEEQERVFEPFYRGHQPQRFPKGLGLGLAIARDLVEAHGGRLEVCSTPGEGSIFTVHLFY